MEETAVNKAIQEGSRWLGTNWRTWAPLAGGIVLSALGLASAFGHKQGATEVTNAQVIEKLTAVDQHLQAIDRTLQSHGERMAALESASNMTQSDVHDLKLMADHASDVAETFKVPRLTGHRAKH